MMIKEYFINNLSKIENDWKRLEIGTEMTSFQTYDWSLLLLKDIKKNFSDPYSGNQCLSAI